MGPSAWAIAEAGPRHLRVAAPEARVTATVNPVCISERVSRQLQGRGRGVAAGRPVRGGDGRLGGVAKPELCPRWEGRRAMPSSLCSFNTVCAFSFRAIYKCIQAIKPIATGGVLLNTPAKMVFLNVWLAITGPLRVSERGDSERSVKGFQPPSYSLLPGLSAGSTKVADLSGHLDVFCSLLPPPPAELEPQTCFWYCFAMHQLFFHSLFL